MSYTPYSEYSHVTHFGNDDDGAYHLNDGAYHSDAGYYSGNNYYSEDPPSNYYDDPEPYAGYQDALHRRAAEHGLTPQELHELDQECVREQEEMERERRQEEEEARIEMRERQWASEREQEEMEMEMEMEQELPGEWSEEHEIEGHRGTPTHVTYSEPEQEVYETYDTADEATDATSPEHDAVFTHTVQSKYTM